MPWAVWGNAVVEVLPDQVLAPGAQRISDQAMRELVATGNYAVIGFGMGSPVHVVETGPVTRPEPASAVQPILGIENLPLQRQMQEDDEAEEEEG